MTRDWTQVNLRLSKELHAMVVKAAIDREQTVNGFLRELIAQGVGVTLDSIAAETVVAWTFPTDAQLSASRRRIALP